MGERQTEDLEVPCSIHGVRTIFLIFFSSRWVNWVWIGWSLGVLGVVW